MADTEAHPGEMTLEEVAAVLGISPGRAYQLETRALAKCRLYCARHGLKFEDLTAAWPRPEWGLRGQREDE